jgi:hypothetical protein
MQWNAASPLRRNRPKFSRGQPAEKSKMTTQMISNWNHIVESLKQIAALQSAATQ